MKFLVLVAVASLLSVSAFAKITTNCSDSTGTLKMEKINKEPAVWSVMDKPLDKTNKLEIMEEINLSRIRENNTTLSSSVLVVKHSNTQRPEATSSRYILCETSTDEVE